DLEPFSRTAGRKPGSRAVGALPLFLAGAPCMAGSLASGTGPVYGRGMSRRLKTLIATILIVFVWLPVYALFIMGLAVHILPGAAWYISLLFYALAGTFWIVPIGLSLPWMYREPAKAEGGRNPP